MCLTCRTSTRCPGAALGSYCHCALPCRHLAELTRLCSPEMTHSASRGTRFSASQVGFWREANACGGPRCFPGASASSAPSVHAPGVDDANRTHSRVTGLRLACAKHCTQTVSQPPTLAVPLGKSGVRDAV